MWAELKHIGYSWYWQGCGISLCYSVINGASGGGIINAIKGKETLQFFYRRLIFKIFRGPLTRGPTINAEFLGKRIAALVIFLTYKKSFIYLFFFLHKRLRQTRCSLFLSPG